MLRSKRGYTSSVVAQFDDLLPESKYIKVYRNCCIPFTSIHSLSVSGVSSLMHVFDGKMVENPCIKKDTHDAVSCGFSTGMDSSIIVELTRLFKKHVNEYLKQKGLSDKQVKQKVQ